MITKHVWPKSVNNFKMMTIITTKSSIALTDITLNRIRRRGKVCFKTSPRIQNEKRGSKPT
jgi:hypothetical protein